MNTQRIILFVCTAIGLVVGIIGMMSDIPLWEGNPGCIWFGISLGVMLSFLISKILQLLEEGFDDFFVKNFLWFILFFIAGPIGFFIRFRQTRD